MAWSPWITWPARGDAVTVVPTEGVGGGVGECERNKGWMCDSWLELARRSGGGTCRLLTDSVSDMTRVGDCMGESGRGSFSSEAVDSWSGKGPSRGLAGETGRLPGMGSRVFFFLLRGGLVTKGLTNSCCSTEDVSQVSNPSPRHEISSESVSRGVTKLPESRGVGPWASMSFVREVMGRMTC